MYLFLFLLSVCIAQHLNGSVNEKNPFYFSPKECRKLLRCGKTDSIKEILTALIKENKDAFNAVVSRKNKRGESLLSLAIETENKEIIKFFLENNANIDDEVIFRGIKSTLLHKAAAHGSVKMTKFFVKKKPELINLKDEIGRTPLHLVSEQLSIYNLATNNYFSILKFLLENKEINIQPLDNKGRTPFQYACKVCAGKEKAKEIIDLFHKKGADMLWKDSFQQTALHKATKRNFRHRYGALEVIKILVEKHKAEIEEEDAAGRTPLHFACEKRNRAAIEYLLEKGANICHKDLFGQTVLHKVLKDSSLIPFLINKGAELDVLDEKGETALHVAAAKNLLGAANELIKNGANLSIISKNGKSPLEAAVDTDMKILLRAYKSWQYFSGRMSRNVPCTLL